MLTGLQGGQLGAQLLKPPGHGGGEGPGGAERIASDLGSHRFQLGAYGGKGSGGVLAQPGGELLQPVGLGGRPFGLGGQPRPRLVDGSHRVAGLLERRHHGAEELIGGDRRRRLGGVEQAAAGHRGLHRRQGDGGAEQQAFDLLQPVARPDTIQALAHPGGTAEDVVEQAALSEQLAHGSQRGNDPGLGGALQPRLAGPLQQHAARVGLEGDEVVIDALEAVLPGGQRPVNVVHRHAHRPACLSRLRAGGGR